ncbi:MAG: Omp28-related outer membrane protein [Bacteroidales bacterium]|nr:Omp28-related outer membrane protein [Bacteroidales bacterium]
MRLYICFIACLVMATAFGQQVSRDKVVVEIATGTWCQYCPAAANGADQLVANGHEVAIIEYHGGDDYQNAYSASRISYYGVTGYPTAFFDGILSFVGGGGATQSNYAQYLAKYNQRINVLSSFTIGFDGSNSGFSDYEINVTVNKVASVTSTNMALHFALTESEIPQVWQGMSELNFVERLMRPNQNGTTLDFSSSSTQEANISFTLGQGWAPEHCQVVAFVQDVATKEVLQGAVRDLSEFGTSNNYDACLKEISGVPVMMCQNTFFPKVKITNYGLETLTALDIVCQVNSEPAITFNWTGNLPYLDDVWVELDPVEFTVNATNIFSVNLENPNGQPDQFPQNDALNFEFEEAPLKDAPIYLIMKTDDHPEETTWEVTDYSGNVLYSGGPYTQPNQNIIETFDLGGDVIECYHFTLYDAGGDGLSGSAIFKLADANQQFFAQGKDFGPWMQVQFFCFATGVSGFSTNKSVTVGPNPFNDFVSVGFPSVPKGEVKVTIYDLSGRQVYSGTDKPGQENSIIIPTGFLQPDVYTLRIEYPGMNYTGKMVRSGR